MVLGKDIKEIRTIGSQYNMDSIVLRTIDNKDFRLKVNELLKILPQLEFDTIKKRVHTYLIIKKP